MSFQSKHNDYKNLIREWTDCPEKRPPWKCVICNRVEVPPEHDDGHVCLHYTRMYSCCLQLVCTWCLEAYQARTNFGPVCQVCGDTSAASNVYIFLPYEGNQLCEEEKREGEEE